MWVEVKAAGLLIIFHPFHHGSVGAEFERGTGEKYTTEVAVVNGLHCASATLNRDQKEETSHSLASILYRQKTEMAAWKSWTSIFGGV